MIVVVSMSVMESVASLCDTPLAWQFSLLSSPLPLGALAGGVWSPGVLAGGVWHISMASASLKGAWPSLEAESSQTSLGVMETPFTEAILQKLRFSCSPAPLASSEQLLSITRSTPEL